MKKATKADRAAKRLGKQRKKEMVDPSMGGRSFIGCRSFFIRSMMDRVGYRSAIIHDGTHIN